MPFRFSQSRRLLPRTVARTLLPLMAALSLSTAHADWPDKPIKLIVPYPAGGLTDIVTRVLADEVGRNLGTSIVVENKAGAGGQIGLDTMLRAPKDGYTIALVVPATMVTLPLTRKDLADKTLFLAVYDEIFIQFGLFAGQIESQPNAVRFYFNRTL